MEEYKNEIIEKKWIPTIWFAGYFVGSLIVDLVSDPYFIIPITGFITFLIFGFIAKRRKNIK